jgi:short-subunit dehydrogenase
MAKGDGLFWVYTKEKAAKQILKAIHNKKDLVYISKRWRIIAFILNNIPRFLYKRM